MTEHCIMVKADYGAIEVCVVRRRGQQPAIWMTWLGARGGRHATIHLTDDEAKAVALRLRQAASVGSTFVLLPDREDRDA